MEEMKIREIEKIMNKNYFRKNDEGIYEIDIYADYRDKLENDSLKKIGSANKEDIWEEFYSCFRTEDCIFAEEDELFKLIKNSLEASLDDSEINDWISENVVFNFPYKHYLNQSVAVNVLIETGESNYDYTKNNFYQDSIEKRWSISDESSLYFLCKQQGYGKKRIKPAFSNPGEHNGVFLHSIYEECLNTTTHMNALVFFVKMTLGEYIAYVTEKKDLTVSKSTRCGLVDFWSGAGSILDIKLDKHVVIPSAKLSIHIDGSFGYSVKEIYGLCDSFWK